MEKFRTAPNWSYQAAGHNKRRLLYLDSTTKRFFNVTWFLQQLLFFLFYCLSIHCVCVNKQKIKSLSGCDFRKICFIRKYFLANINTYFFVADVIRTI